jgi:glycerol-3-phosphate acyltransferase PlsY
MEVLTRFLLCYLIGSIPFGYIISKMFGKVDIRKSGSKNIGATNVARVLGFLPGLSVLILDVLKGFIPVKVFSISYPQYAYLFGLGCIVGHCWTVFLKFKGGKGVATTLGVLGALNSVYLLYILAVWIFIFSIFRIVSLASISSAVALPLILILKGIKPQALLFIGLYSCIIIIRHKENIKRLFRGEEKRFQFKR